MKKINLIIALSVVTMGTIVPASILISNNQNVVKNKKIDDDSVNNDQSIDDNDLIFNNNISDLNASNNNNKSKVVGEIINANSATCTAENSLQNTNTWMGITSSEFVKFTVTKDWVSSSDVGTVWITGVSVKAIASSKLTIPNYIINNGNKYDVTSIGANAFNACSDLTGTLIIPAGITSIGDSAFNGCTSLTGLDLSNATSLVTISGSAFQSCSGLTGLDLSNATSLQTIDGSAFAYCSDLTGTLIISANVIFIGIGAFQHCSSLTGTLIIPANVTSIDNSAFISCSGLTGLDLSNATSLQTIGISVFNSCSSLTGTLTIPASVTTIGNGAFQNCFGLTGVVISASVISIGISAFFGCVGLITLDLSNATSLVTIGDFAFRSCSKLTSLELSNATSLATIGDSAFAYCSGLTGTLTIPANVIFIGIGAFQHCSSLTGTLIIPASVTSIGNSAFFDCSGLTGTLTIPTNVTTIGDSVFTFCSGLTGTLTIPANVTSIGINAFANCSGLTGLDLSNATNLKTIGNVAFENCSGLTGNLTIPASVTSIGNKAFQHCYGLAGTLTIPASVIEIGNNAFDGTKYTNVYFSMTTPPATLGNNIFGLSNSKITINVPKGTKVAWDATPDILTKLGIVNLSQIVEPKTPPTDITINVDLNQTMKIGESLVINPTVTLDPIDADDDLNWSIIDSTSEVIIDSKTGKITYKPNTIGSKQLKLHVQSVVAPSTVADAIINITVSYAPVTSVTINETTKTNFDIELKSTSNNFISNYTATVDPTNADQNVNWKLIEANIPTWLKIDNNGKLYYDQIEDISLVNKSYNCNIVATSVGVNTLGETVSSNPLTITINVVEPIIPDPQPSSDFPVWAYLVIIGATSVIVSSLTITIVTIKRKNKDE